MEIKRKKMKLSPTRLEFEWRPCRAREGFEAPAASNAHRTCFRPTFALSQSFV